MRREDINDLEKQASSLAEFGYECGFKDACDLIREVANDAPKGTARQNAEFFASLIEDAMPKMLEKAKKHFNFKVVREDADGFAHLEIVE